MMNPVKFSVYLILLMNKLFTERRRYSLRSHVLYVTFGFNGNDL